MSTHPSVNEISAEKHKAIALEPCFDLFTQREKLSATDAWYCIKCKEHREAFKKFDIWKLPRVVVVHLKRFQFSRTWREKIDALVDFPVRGLDLARYVQGPGKNEPQIYDLFGVSNHSGGMGFGHYTAYAKNHREGKWYKFNDSYVTEAEENEVITREAYLLFYERREDTNIKPIEFEYEEERIGTAGQTKKDPSLNDIDEDDDHAASKKPGSGSANAGYYTSTSPSPANPTATGKELVLVGDPAATTMVDVDHDDAAEEGLGLLRTLKRGKVASGVAPSPEETS
jgi:hypothetical protein